MGDTTKVTVTKDTIFRIDTTLTSQKTIVEITNYDKQCDCSTNFCDCKLMSDLIWPLTILLIILLFYKKLKELIGHIGGRARKIKGPGFEVELDELNKTTEKVESKIEDRSSETSTQTSGKFDYVVSNDLPTEILKISIDIEKTLRTIYEMSFLPSDKKPLAVSVLIETLRENNVIDFEQTKLLRQFWIFRNNIVHAISYKVTEQEFLSFMDIGIRISKILNNILAKITEQQIRRLKSLGSEDPDVDLFLGVFDNNSELVRKSLDRGANPNITDLELLRKYKSKLTKDNS